MYNGIGGKIRLVWYFLFIQVYFKNFEIRDGGLFNFDYLSI